MRLVKFILLILAAIIVLLGAGFVVAGLLAPAEQSFTNEVEINAPADRVWQVLTDRSKYIEWQPNLTRIEVIDERTWLEYPKDLNEPLRLTLVKDERPDRMEIDYVMGTVMRGNWKGEMSPAAGGVRLRTIDSYSANGWLAKIPIYFFFDLDAFAKDWNQKLKQRAESLLR